MQTKVYELKGLEQANAFLTSSNYMVMAQLAHMTVTTKATQAQLKTIAYDKTNQARTKRNH